MPHFRQRHLEDLFQKLIRFGPILGLFGHRQTGKSTWASSAAGEYFTLDDANTLKTVLSDAPAFIRSRKKYPCVIDESQNAPPLFPALKERVRTNKRPGQFLLTGSVRFSSRKAIRESLAGRISNIELFPLSIAELSSRPLPETVPELLNAKSFAPSALTLLPPATLLSKAQKDLEKYLEQGGLPGMCFTREKRLRSEQLKDLIDLVLDRDLRMIVQTKLSLETMRRFLAILANNAFEPYNASQAKRELGLAHVTQKQLLYALESIFLVRPLRILGSPKMTYLLEDQFEESFLSQRQLPQLTVWASALYRNIRSQFAYRAGLQAQYTTYLTRGGAKVPLVIEANGSSLGIIPIEGETPTLSQKRSADSYLRQIAQGKIIFASIRNHPARVLDSRSLVCSAAGLV